MSCWLSVGGWWSWVGGDRDPGPENEKGRRADPGGLSEKLCVSLADAYGECSERGRAGRFLRSNTMKVAGLAMAPWVQVDDRWLPETWCTAGVPYIGASAVPVGQPARVTAPRRAAPAEASRPALVCASVLIVTGLLRAGRAQSRRLGSRHRTTPWMTSQLHLRHFSDVGCGHGGAGGSSRGGPGLRRHPQGAAGGREPGRPAAPRCGRSV